MRERVRKCYSISTVEGGNKGRKIEKRQGG